MNNYARNSRYYFVQCDTQILYSQYRSFTQGKLDFRNVCEAMPHLSYCSGIYLKETLALNVKKYLYLKINLFLVLKVTDKNNRDEAEKEEEKTWDLCLEK